MSEENDFKNIKTLFISDPTNAIEKCQELICSLSDFNSFSNFYKYHLKHPHISTCQNEWTKPQMSIHCNVCSIAQQSCFCLQCFLNSDHQEHDYIINPNSTGNCDCGDLSMCKRIGFCKNHQGLEDDAHPEEYLSEKLRVVLTDTIFKAAFSSIKHLRTDNGEKLSIIIKFLSSFLKFGDGFRRLLTISLTEKINAYKLFSSVFEASIEFNELLQQFCGLLVNDQLFKVNFSKINYKLMIDKTMPNAIKSLISDKERQNFEIWDSYWFHSYSPNLFQYNIDHNGWDWVKFCLKGLKYMKEPLRFIGDPKFKNMIPDYFKYAVNLSDASKIQPNEQTQQLFDKLCTKILIKGTTKGISEGINDINIITSFKDNLEESYFNVLLYFNFIFYFVIHCFKSKKNLKVDKLIESLNENIDISKIYYIGKNIVESNVTGENENDKFVMTLIEQKNLKETEIKDDNYRSFHNGGTFYILYPIVHSFACLLREDNLNRIKIAKLISMPIYRPLRIKLGIVTLKSILSMVCLHESLNAKKNFGAIGYLSSYIGRPPLANFGLSLLLPVIQLLIGIDQKENGFCDKEFFAFEMAREIGLFDDFKSNEYKDEDVEENQKQMIFSFLYLSILLVIERTLFNFDIYNFVREQVIFALKRGVNNLNDLNDSYDQFIATTTGETVKLNEVVSEVATVRQPSNATASDEKEQISSNRDVLFDLKEDIECNIISAINSINGEKSIMNDEITKHPDELLKMQQFEDEDQYFFKSNDEEEKNLSKGLKIQLKDFLMTPTVLSVIYHTLRTNSENGHSHKVELNDHLAMNVLLLISQFVRNKKGGSDNFDEKTVISYNSTISDLISQMKKTVFKYNIESNDNARIENTLTKKSFKIFLKIKIEINHKEPKSLFDVLLDRGEIGKKVLRRMKIKTRGSDSQLEKEDLEKMKKDRARRMKEEIMNHYKNATISFNTNGIQSSDFFASTSNMEKESCSICSTVKKNEVLSYPVYIYRTKFPFIVDKPPLISMQAQEALKEREVYDDDSNEQIELDENDLNELESQYPSIDDMMNHFLHNCPQLVITNETSEEEKEHIESVLESVRRTFEKKIESEHERINELKKEFAHKRIIKNEQKKKEDLKREEFEKDPNKVVEMRLTPGNLFVIQFGICQHQVHHKCVGEESEFTCPIDRSHKNGFLPNINDLQNESIFTNEDENNCEVTSENLRDEFKESLNFFIEKYSRFFISSNNRVVDVFVELVKSLSGLISTYEIRIRNLPDCLDSQKTFLLSRNLFLATWYAYRMRGKPKMSTGFNSEVSYEIESRLTVFQKFIKKLIENDDIVPKMDSKDSIVCGIVASFVDEMKKSSKPPKEICLFLRRVCLSDHFFLNESDEEERFIDWDEVLSSSSLSERFNVDIQTITFSDEFKPFSFMKMPKEFIRFAQPPFNFPVDQTQKIFLVSILDYNFMIEHYSDIEEMPMSEEEIEEKNRRSILYIDPDDVTSSIAAHFSSKNYPSVLLSVGEAASKVLVVDGRKTISLRPFYLDKYGCTDVGYSRNQPLFLNEDRYDRFMDEVLSGEFSNDLHPF